MARAILYASCVYFAAAFAVEATAKDKKFRPARYDLPPQARFIDHDDWKDYQEDLEEYYKDVEKSRRKYLKDLEKHAEKLRKKQEKRLRRYSGGWRSSVRFPPAGRPVYGPLIPGAPQQLDYGISSEGLELLPPPEDHYHPHPRQR